MSGWAKIGLAVLLGVSAVVVFVNGARRFVEQRAITTEVERLRDELFRARVSADRCRGSLAASESALQTLTLTVDSLRSQIDSFEALGGGNVPSTVYDEYLGVFESYNDSVAAWEVRSERLIAAESACRSVISEHNAISDSIQTILDGLGGEE